MGNEQDPDVVPNEEEQRQWKQNRFKMLGQTGLLTVTPGELHKVAGTEHGVPHWLVDQRQVRGVGVEGVMAVEAVPGEVGGVGDDEEGKQDGGSC